MQSSLHTQPLHQALQNPRCAGRTAQPGTAVSRTPGAQNVLRRLSSVDRKTCADFSSVKRSHGTRSRNTLQVISAAFAEPIMSDVTVLEQPKTSRLQTQVLPIGANTTTIRSLDWDRDRFDIEFALEMGTTYNSYVIKGEKIALIDSSHAKMRQLYLDALSGVINPADIEYIVVSHTEPDHSGLIGDLLELAPNAKVYGSKVCIAFLENMVHRPFTTHVVKNGDTLDLGGGHVLTFIVAPNLHWPDTIFTHDAATKHLYTCDAYGMHYCTEEVFDEDVSALMKHYKFYYDCLMGPNARSVLTAMRKCKDLEVESICVGHGPILRNNLEEMMGKYSTWSNQALEKSPASVALFYESLYGRTEELSQALERGILKTEAEVELVDLSVVDTQDLLEAVARNSGIVLMCPPADSPAADMIGTILAATSKKQPVVIAESYGGNDEPVDTLMRDFQEQGISMPIPALRVKDEPTEGTFQLYEESGTDLGQILTKKASLLAVKSMDPAVAKALGKVGGGLYVVTAAKADARSAMIASWISQASFEPLGFTVAVAKDRAIEQFMHVGDTFVLNCMREGEEAPLMKHFLKRFPPGADRFEGMDVSTAANGSPILKAGAAYMECTVKSRMETPDHWIVYSEVEGGGVSGDDRTATHTRQVATYY